jgi:NADPH-dependent 2,4-dienoyl-CoA reductase/sulfur reductase-like enzyme
MKGLRWQVGLRTSGTLVVGGVLEVEALGADRVEHIRYRTTAGWIEAEASVLLVHEGVVPSIHPALSLDCRMEWNEAQDSFAPVVDEWGESSRAGVFIAGDGAGIGGARAAQLRGELSAIRIAEHAGRIEADAAIALAGPIRRRLRRELAARPFLDALFKPRRSVFHPADETVVCRCEGVTAGEVRKLATASVVGPNQIKAATRTGMGPCQGRQCGYTVTRLVAETQGRTPAEVGFMRVRPPLRPVTLGELASLRGEVQA